MWLIDKFNVKTNNITDASKGNKTSRILVIIRFAGCKNLELILKI
jgi:hypothetical protein